MRRPASDPSNAILLEAIERLGKKQDDFMEKLLEVEKSVASNSVLISDLTLRIDAVEKYSENTTVRSGKMDSQLSLLVAENKRLWDKVDELDAYKRRWNLRISGVLEEERENVKMIILDIFRQVSPGLADVLQSSIDVAHRLGPKLGYTRPRTIIVQFLSRSHRDRIWADARRSEVLKQKKIRISKDLTQRTKEARNKLWPLVEKARKEGAGFRGPNAVVDGKRISATDV
ncbi:hypothetical protein DPEC_G00186500 [Dallia pectoralis]|uniref:Uncharacterized protein n=1 Tax=Dallia pectoralis TaxID=75939 RepID=A0ACC2GBP8_DALPE|nr:hypothetical protein DPEC_G00186500 [Dallia pectoralis]